MIFSSFNQLKKEINEFDFSSLEFQKKESSPIFWNSNSSKFEAWETTNIETAEQLNSVMHIGYLTELDANNGEKPKPDEIRIKTHFTREIN